MIKTSSANVSRLGVEAALNALPEVERSFVASLPDAERGGIVAAAVLPAVGATPTEEHMRAALRDRLSAFKIPRRLVFIGEAAVPVLATGKDRLFELAQMIESCLADHRPHPPPISGTTPRPPPYTNNT